MHKYSLELMNLGRWELERDFSTLSAAIEYGKQNFPQNEWRVFDRVAQENVYTYDHVGAIEQAAGHELQRFARTNELRNFFNQRNVDNLPHLRSIASQQRERQQLAARMERIRGFRFVGGAPQILNHEFIWDFEEDTLVNKVNWLKEGF
jgi:hypothetical protein